MVDNALLVGKQLHMNSLWEGDVSQSLSRLQHLDLPYIGKPPRLRRLRFWMAANQTTLTPAIEHDRDLASKRLSPWAQR